MSIASLPRDTEVVLQSHLEEMTEYLEQFLDTLSPTASLSCPTEQRPGPGEEPGEEPWEGHGEGPGEEPWEGPGEGPGEEPWEGPGEEPWEGPGEEPWEGPGDEPWDGPWEGPGDRQGILETLESGDARVVLDEDPWPWPPAAHTVDNTQHLPKETDDIPLPPPKLTDIIDWEDIREGGEGRRFLARQAQGRELQLGPRPTSSALSFPSSSYSSSTSCFSSCTLSSPSSSSLSSPLRSPLTVLAMLSWIQNTL